MRDMVTGKSGNESLVALHYNNRGTRRSALVLWLQIPDASSLVVC